MGRLGRAGLLVALQGLFPLVADLGQPRADEQSVGGLGEAAGSRGDLGLEVGDQALDVLGSGGQSLLEGRLEVAGPRARVVGVSAGEALEDPARLVEAAEGEQRAGAV